MDTLISNVTVVTMNEAMDVIFGGFVGIEKGKISYLAKKAPTDQPEKIIDGTLASGSSLTVDAENDEIVLR